jgi:hypothetical protein
MGMATMWKLVGERTLAGPQAGESVEQAVVALLPAGPRTRFLDRALAEDVVAAVLYLQHCRNVDHVCLQCYQRCEDAANSGWSFFLVEKTLDDGCAAVQAYLFHE